MSLQQTVLDYFSTLNNGNRAGWLATFSDAPELRHADPVNGPARTTKAQLAEYFDQMLGLFVEVHLDVGTTFEAGPDHLALTFTGRGRGQNGVAVEFSGIDVFWGDADGKILRLEAYWNAGATVAQLMS